MFTGIVENLATVMAKGHSRGKTYSLLIDLKGTTRNLRRGESIAVNGVCLTLVGKTGNYGNFQVIKETLNRTNLGQLGKGSRVNIERSLAFNQRISGHLVTGHIDGTGKIVDLQPQDDGSTRMAVTAKRKIVELMVEKGAVALDGVSLTIVDVSNSCFSICLIPYTLKTTTLGLKKKSDLVNIEADYVGKYVLKFAKRYKQMLSA